MRGMAIERWVGSRAGPVARETQAAAATHSSVAMRRLARAVDGATTEAGAWKPDEAMVMSEAAMVRVGDHSGRTQLSSPGSHANLHGGCCDAVRGLRGVPERELACGHHLDDGQVQGAHQRRWPGGLVLVLV